MPNHPFYSHPYATPYYQAALPELMRALQSPNGYDRMYINQMYGLMARDGQLTALSTRPDILGMATFGGGAFAGIAGMLLDIFLIIISLVPF